MKISQELGKRLSIVIGGIAWLAMTFSDIIFVFDNTFKSTNINIHLPDFFLSIFIFCTYIYFHFDIVKAESTNILSLLWKIFVVGLLITISSLLAKAFMSYFRPTSLKTSFIWIDFFYDLNLGFIITFLIGTFTVWKRLILYNKSILLLRTWKLFEISLFSSVIFLFLDLHRMHYLRLSIFGLFLVLSIALSANLKWVAYLNFKQKWRSILLILLVFIYLLYFWFYLNEYSLDYAYALRVNVAQELVLISLFAFVSIYAIFSLLVILFNLPTSSVFEQKLSDALSFNRLLQTRDNAKKEDEVYEIFLESATSAVIADAAWLEIYDKSFEISEILMHELDKSKISQLREIISKTKLEKLYKNDHQYSPSKFLSFIPDLNFHSILTCPLYVKEEQIATLTLLKYVKDGFNRDMQGIVHTFSNQASVSIENIRLVKEAIKNERYKEEIKIAKKVQNRLIPNQLFKHSKIDIKAFTKSAEEVGGDYYDFYVIDQDRVALIIGDVSGKGVSAAFHLAEMKGAFQSLTRLNLKVDKIIEYINAALSNCMENNAFITLSYYLIDTNQKQITYSRAGHCPHLYYNSIKDEATYAQDKGLGIGLLRNNTYKKYVSLNELNYNIGDTLILYTDGITEAKNLNKEEYGSIRFRNSFLENKDKEISDLKDNMIQSVHDFNGNKELDDDYTLIILKFKDK